MDVYKILNFIASNRKTIENTLNIADALNDYLYKENDSDSPSEIVDELEEKKKKRKRKIFIKQTENLITQQVMEIVLACCKNKEANPATKKYYADIDYNLLSQKLETEGLGKFSYLHLKTMATWMSIKSYSECIMMDICSEQGLYQ